MDRLATEEEFERVGRAGGQRPPTADWRLSRVLHGFSRSLRNNAIVVSSFVPFRRFWSLMWISNRHSIDCLRWSNTYCYSFHIADAVRPEASTDTCRRSPFYFAVAPMGCTRPRPRPPRDRRGATLPGQKRPRGHGLWRSPLRRRGASPVARRHGPRASGGGRRVDE